MSNAERRTSRQSRYRAQLAHDAFNGLLEFFMRWLEYVDGYELDGQWHPSNGMDKARCAALINQLTLEQLDGLCWRGLIPAPDAGSRRPPSLLWGESARIFVGPGIHIINDPAYEQRLYGLPGGPEIRLRIGELELLYAAGFPKSWDGVLAVLWRRIAAHDQTRHTLGGRFREISAIVHHASLDASSQLAQLRELVPPPAATDSAFATALLRVVRAEHTVIQAAFGAVEDGWADSDLATAIQELRAASAAVLRMHEAAQRQVDLP
ncbi:MAG TPA: hypothetical protein VFS21_40330 [Roseiflexaceae bacterium]|nr:hypothetical protein [Roseiflexaceae bacterium]